MVSNRVTAIVHPVRLSREADQQAAGDLRLEEAAELQSETCATMQRVLGREHPETLQSASDLASTFHTQGRYMVAAKLQSETRAIR